MRSPIVLRSLALVLASASLVLAEEQTLTVAPLHDGTPGGVHVADSSGRHLIIKDAVFADLVDSEDAVTVGGEVTDGRLDVAWVRALVLAEMKLTGGKKVPAGSELKLLGRTTKVVAGEAQHRYDAILPDGSRVTLPAKYAYSFTVSDEKSAHRTQGISGVVESAGDKLYLTEKNGNQREIVGDSAALLRRAVGRYVTGSAITYDDRRAVEFAVIQGTTNKSTKALLSTEKKTGRALAANKGIDIAAMSDGFAKIRIDWSSGSSPDIRQAFVPEAHVELGQRFVDLEGTVVMTDVGGNKRIAIQGATDTYVVHYGGAEMSGGLFAGLIGRKVHVGGAVVSHGEGRGELALQWIDATAAAAVPASNGSPAIAKGTRLRVFDAAQEYTGAVTLRVRLPDGTLASVPFDRMSLEAPAKTAGIVSFLDE